MLQGQRDLATVSRMILAELAPLVSAQHGVFYALTELGDGGAPVLQFQAGYGYKERKHLANHFRLGEGLVGQCALEKERILLTDVPSDYIQINSGLGESKPLNIIVLPILFEGSVRAVIELASFAAFSSVHQSFLDQLTESIGLVLNTVAANTVTEQLLEQSLSQSEELQSQQEELRQSNEDLAEQATLLEGKNDEVEGKYQEVEEAKLRLEEQAAELAVSSKYKSEFIANMSHELRTPLNSLLVLAEQLEDNSDGNLTDRQVEYAKVIRCSGMDLLRLLNDILDLAKVESHTVQFEITDVSLAELRTTMLRTFLPIAEGQGLAFSVELDEQLPATIVTDPHRLRQVVNNLLSNAFKFTSRGNVAVRMGLSTDGWNRDHEALERAPSVIAMSFSDTGIGVRRELQLAMFEPFAQADGTTAREHGGTGLGLSISRNLIRLLGGDITLTSKPGTGSTFTVYLPVTPDDVVLGQLAPTRQSPPSPPPVEVSAATSLAVDVTTTNGHRVGQRSADALTEIVGPPTMAAGTNGVAEQAPTAEPKTELAAPEEAKLAAGPTARASLAQSKVLVVDDHFPNVFALTALLERGHMIVVPAQSGPEALAILDRDDDIDVVLMDIMMPVMDGYQTMTAIRTREKYADLPIIAVTGKVVGSERERCIAAGASDYIPKPVDTSSLLDALAIWLQPRRPTLPRSEPG